MGKTLKAGTTGRFGARYGRSVKLRVRKIEDVQKRQKHKCPLCGIGRAKRLSAGVFYCSKCDRRFAGGAYVPATLTGRLISKMVIQKRFMPYVSELISASEQVKGTIPREAPSEAEEPEGAGSSATSHEKAAKPAAKALGHKPRAQPA